VGTSPFFLEGAVKVHRLRLIGFSLGCVLGSMTAFAQNPSAAPSEYSFTISGSQSWTDTGIDLSAGDTLTFTADAQPATDSTCAAPPSASSSSSSDKLPVADAAAGALIAKTSEKGDPMLAGSGHDVHTDAAGHLFLGLNQTATSSCALAVKLTIAHGQAAAPAPQCNLKDQLSSAAKVWMSGQFGNSSSSSSTPASNAISENGNTSAASSPSPGLKLPAAVLDSDLRQHLDGLPRRVHDHLGNLGDMVNFVIVGSQEQVQAALDASDWHLADLDSKESGLKAVMDTYEKKDYLQMPMSHLYLFDRMQDFGYEQAQAFAVVATRHHFRLWKAPFTWNNQTVWCGAGTHDVGFEKDVRTGKLTHKIDPAVDGERENIAQSLDKSGKAKSMTYYLPPNPVQDAKNASGGAYHSDGRLLVVFLK
jgi:LssY C-terminus